MNTEYLSRLAVTTLPLFISAVTALMLSLGPALLVALVLAEWAPRPIKHRGTRALQALGALPLVAVVMGMFAFSRSPELPGTLPSKLPTATLMAAAALVPRMASLIIRALRDVPRETRRSGAALGAHPLIITGTLVLPGARNGLLRAVFAGFSGAIAETALVLVFTPFQELAWPLFILAFLASFLAADPIRGVKP